METIRLDGCKNPSVNPLIFYKYFKVGGHLNHQMNLIDELSCIKEKSEMEELLKRKIAEFENYKKRTLKEKEEILQYANTNFLKKSIEVLDAFEKYCEWADKNDREDTHICQINKLFKELLMGECVSKMDVSIDDEFDVDKHEAIMQEGSNLCKNHITKVLQDGYVYKDKVLRYAKVIVSDGSGFVLAD